MKTSPCLASGVAALGLLLVASLAGCTPAESPGPPAEGAGHLFVWAGDADERHSDFLAIIDARRSAPSYGRVLATLPVGARGTMPHHTEYEYPDNDILFANGWVSGQTFLIDLEDPLHPRLAGQFRGVEGYGFPHSFARLPDGHVLATFQARGDSYAPPGGLVELDAQGRAVQSASAAVAGVDDSLIWPYSLVVLPEIDRAVSTSADMGMPPWDAWPYHDTHHVQVWSLVDLRLLATVALPEVEGATYHIGPAEPRMLADGTVYVNTFSCGLYRLDGLDGATPEAEFVHAFPGGASETECGVPVVVGRYWIQTVPAVPGLIVLDVSDSREPIEVSRLELGERYPMPHWLAADRTSPRIVATGDHGSWVLLLELDPNTGTLRIDESFREEGAAHAGLDFSRSRWPHGETGGAVVHGALFGQ